MNKCLCDIKTSNTSELEKRFKTNFTPRILNIEKYLCVLIQDTRGHAQNC